MKHPYISSMLFIATLTSCSDDDKDVCVSQSNPFTTPPVVAEPVIAEHVIAAPIRDEPITAEEVKAEELREKSTSKGTVSEPLAEKKNLTGVDDGTQSYFAANYSTFPSANYWDSDEEE